MGGSAILFGIAAFIELARNPGAFQGKGFAKTGIILGCISIILVGLIVLDSQSAKKADRLRQTHRDLQILSVSLEAYCVDNNMFPPSLFVLTSPVPFSSRIPSDPFMPDNKINYFHFSGASDEKRYFLWGAGPDEKLDLTPDILRKVFSDWDQNGHLLYERTYDPTNGTPSAGDRWRTNDERAAPKQ